MARKPMVTRTIKTTKVSVMCLDIVSAEPTTEVVELAGTYKADSKLLEKIKSLIETDNLKVVTITSKDEIETLYGMSEDDFVKNSVKLDKETRKEVE